MVKEITCPACKRKFNLPENYKPAIILEENTNKEKQFFICPCCRNKIEID